MLGNLFRASDVSDGFPLALHYIMFMPAIMNQGTDEQQAQWLPRAWDCRIIGSYAQVSEGSDLCVHQGVRSSNPGNFLTQIFLL